MTSQTAPIPTLETDRLTLRPMRPEDFADFARMMASDRARYMGGPFDTASAWGGFCHGMATWTFFGRGTLMITLSETGTVIGETGLNDGPLFPETELGWSLYDGFEKQGYATEAARALRDWAFASGGVDTLVSYTDPENHASQAVARRLGAMLDPDAPRTDPKDLVWRHVRPS